MKNDLNALKEASRLIVAFLLETEDDAAYWEFEVYPDKSQTIPDEIAFNIQVPHSGHIYVNKVSVPAPLDNEGIKQIEQRMAQLAKERTYPAGSFFATPWSMYLIHGGKIGKI